MVEVPDPQRRVHALVAGRVQGVWFRKSTQRQAADLGLVGWVRNRHDGRVELEAQGSREAVQGLLAWIEAGGPPRGRVDEVEVAEQDPGGDERRFEVRPDA